MKNPYNPHNEVRMANVDYFPRPIPPGQSLANNLKQFRLWRRMSQRQLAERAGTTQATIARLESGQGNPTFDLATRVLAELGYEFSLQMRKIPPTRLPGDPRRP